MLWDKKQYPIFSIYSVFDIANVAQLNIKIRHKKLLDKTPYEILWMMKAQWNMQLYFYSTIMQQIYFWKLFYFYPVHTHTKSINNSS